MTNTKKIDGIHSRLDKIALKGKDNYLEFSNYFNDLSKAGDYDNLLQCLYIHYIVDIDEIKNYETFKKGAWKSILFRTDSSMNKRIKKLYDKKLVYQNGFDIYSFDTNFIGISLSNPFSSTYSVTNFPKGISISSSNKIISLGITNSNIYDITISKAIWGTASNIPKNIQEFQKIVGVTQSTYKLEIPTTQDTQWLITTYERPGYKELKYKLNINTTNKYLGQIIEEGIFTDEYKYLMKNKEFARITKTRKTFLEVKKVDIEIPEKDTDGKLMIESIIIDQDDLKLSEDNNLYNRYVIAVNLLLS
jgi:hypothetical protein